MTNAAERTAGKSAWVRHSAALMAVIFFYVNVAYGALEPAANFWKERRKEADKAAAGGGRSQAQVPLPANDATLLAQLPGLNADLLPASVLPSGNLGSFAPLSALHPSREAEGSSLSGEIARRLPPRLQSLPLGRVQIRDAYIPEDWQPSDLMVVQIQDAHENVEAQRNIARVIEALAGENPSGSAVPLPLTTYRPPLVVGIEGARGAFNFVPYRTFPDRQVAKEVATYLLKESFITGPEYVGMTFGLEDDLPAESGKERKAARNNERDNKNRFLAAGNQSSALSSDTAVPSVPDAVHLPLTAYRLPLFWGVEDETLYLNHVRAYKEAVVFEGEGTALYDGMQRALAALKERVLGAELKALSRMMDRYHAGEVKLGEYLKFLAVGKKAAAGKMTRSFLEALALEESLDYAAVEKERMDLMRELARKLPAPELKNLATAGLSYRLGELTYGAFYRYLKELTSAYGVALGRYPQMERYIRYVHLSERVKVEELFGEMRDLEEARLRSLARGEKEKKVLALSSDVDLIGKLTKFGLSPEEWEEYRGRKEEIARIPDRMSDLGGVPPALPGGWQDLIARFGRFNEAAVARNEALTRNLLDKAKETGRPGTVAVLVAGGFHTRGVSQILKDKRTAYLVLTPRLGKVEGSGTDYLEAFKGDQTPLDKLFTGERINLAPQLGSPEKQMGEAPVSAPRNLHFGFSAFSILGLVRKEAAGASHLDAKTQDDIRARVAEWISALGGARFGTIRELIIRRMGEARDGKGRLMRLMLRLHVLGDRSITAVTLEGKSKETPPFLDVEGFQVGESPLLQMETAEGPNYLYPDRLSWRDRLYYGARSVWRNVRTRTNSIDLAAIRDAVTDKVVRLSLQSEKWWGGQLSLAPQRADVLAPVARPESRAWFGTWWKRALYYLFVSGWEEGLFRGVGLLVLPPLLVNLGFNPALAQAAGFIVSGPLFLFSHTIVRWLVKRNTDEWRGWEREIASEFYVPTDFNLRSSILNKILSAAAGFLRSRAFGTVVFNLPFLTSWTYAGRLAASVALHWGWDMPFGLKGKQGGGPLQQISTLVKDPRNYVMTGVVIALLLQPINALHPFILNDLLTNGGALGDMTAAVRLLRVLQLNLISGVVISAVSIPLSFKGIVKEWRRGFRHVLKISAYGLVRTVFLIPIEWLALTYTSPLNVTLVGSIHLVIQPLIFSYFSRNKNIEELDIRMEKKDWAGVVLTALGTVVFSLGNQGLSASMVGNALIVGYVVANIFVNMELQRILKNGKNGENDIDVGAMSAYRFFMPVLPSFAVYALLHHFLGAPIPFLDVSFFANASSILGLFSVPLILVSSLFFYAKLRTLYETTKRLDIVRVTVINQIAPVLGVLVSLAIAFSSGQLHSVFASGSFLELITRSVYESGPSLLQMGSVLLVLAGPILMLGKGLTGIFKNARGGLRGMFAVWKNGEGNKSEEISSLTEEKRDDTIRPALLFFAPLRDIGRNLKLRFGNRSLPVFAFTLLFNLYALVLGPAGETFFPRLGAQGGTALWLGAGMIFSALHILVEWFARAKELKDREGYSWRAALGWAARYDALPGLIRFLAYFALYAVFSLPFLMGTDTAMHDYLASYGLHAAYNAVVLSARSILAERRKAIGGVPAPDYAPDWMRRRWNVFADMLDIGDSGDEQRPLRDSFSRMTRKLWREFRKKVDQGQWNQAEARQLGILLFAYSQRPERFSREMSGLIDEIGAEMEQMKFMIEATGEGFRKFPFVREMGIEEFSKWVAELRDTLAGVLQVVRRCRNEQFRAEQLIARTILLERYAPHRLDTIFAAANLNDRMKRAFSGYCGLAPDEFTGPRHVEGAATILYRPDSATKWGMRMFTGRRKEASVLLNLDGYLTAGRLAVTEEMKRLALEQFEKELAEAESAQNGGTWWREMIAFFHSKGEEAAGMPLSARKPGQVRPARLPALSTERPFLNSILRSGVVGTVARILARLPLASLGADALSYRLRHPPVPDARPSVPSVPPVLKLEGDADAPVREILSAFALENALWLGETYRDDAAGLSAHAFEVPGFTLAAVPQGLEVLRELIDPEQWRTIAGRPQRFEALYRERRDAAGGLVARELLAIFPVGKEDAQDDSFAYFDFCDYYAPYGLLRGFDALDIRERWRVFAGVRDENRAAIERYRQARGAVRFKRRWNASEQTPFGYVEMQAEGGGIRAVPFDPGVFLKGGESEDERWLLERMGSETERGARTVFVIPPTVYSPFDAVHRAADAGYWNYLLEEVARHPFRERDRILDPTLGSGFILWLLYQRLPERFKDAGGCRLKFYGCDRNPLAVAAARINLVRLSGIPVELAVHDNILAADGGPAFPDPAGNGRSLEFSLIAANGPTFPVVEAGRRRILRYVEYVRAHFLPAAQALDLYHDGGDDGAAFWVRILGGLDKVLEPVRGRLVVWTAAPFFYEDPVKIMVRRRSSGLRLERSANFNLGILAPGAGNYNSLTIALRVKKRDGSPDRSAEAVPPAERDDFELRIAEEAAQEVGRVPEQTELLPLIRRRLLGAGTLQELEGLKRLQVSDRFQRLVMTAKFLRLNAIFGEECEKERDSVTERTPLVTERLDRLIRYMSADEIAAGVARMRRLHASDPDRVRASLDAFAVQLFQAGGLAAASGSTRMNFDETFDAFREMAAILAPGAQITEEIRKTARRVWDQGSEKGRTINRSALTDVEELWKSERTTIETKTKEPAAADSSRIGVQAIHAFDLSSPSADQIRMLAREIRRSAESDSRIAIPLITNQDTFDLAGLRKRLAAEGIDESLLGKARFGEIVITAQDFLRKQAADPAIQMDTDVLRGLLMQRLGFREEEILPIDIFTDNLQRFTSSWRDRALQILIVASVTQVVVVTQGIAESFRAGRIFSMQQ